MLTKLGRIVYSYDFNKKNKMLTLQKTKFLKGYRDEKLKEYVKLNAGDICLIFDQKNEKNYILDSNKIYNKVLVNGNLLWIESKYLYTDLTKAEVV
jgi:hypothetical protein